MLRSFLFQKLADPEISRDFFYLIEIGLGAIFLILIWYFRPRSPDSQFRVRESDRKKESQHLSSQKRDPQAFANAKIQKKIPLQLPGIRLDGTAHEILGVPPQASPEQIQKAYRELMKRYHPDRIGRPGTREWEDAQKIAEVINQAKDELLKGKPGK